MAHRTARLRSVVGIFEALTTPHGVDRYLELVNPMLTVRELRAEVTDVVHPTADSVTLTLRPTRQWRGFAAGQYVQLTVEVDGVRRTRCFSPSCSQHRADGRIELTVKANAGGLVSQHLKRHARRGLVVGLSQADGTFQLPAGRPDRLVFISGGSGITPVLSMLRTLCDEGYVGEVAFLHYSCTEADVAYLSQLRELPPHTTTSGWCWPTPSSRPAAICTASSTRRISPRRRRGTPTRRAICAARRG